MDAIVSKNHQKRTSEAPTVQRCTDESCPIEIGNKVRDSHRSSVSLSDGKKLGEAKKSTVSGDSKDGKKTAYQGVAKKSNAVIKVGGDGIKSVELPAASSSAESTKKSTALREAIIREANKV